MRRLDIAKFTRAPAMPIKAILLATAAASATAAGAQTTNATVSPLHINADNHGVDVVTGGLVVSQPLMSIGTGTIGLSINANNFGGGWLNDYSGTVSGLPNGASATVAIGSKAWRFTLSGTTYTALDGMGETLVAGANSGDYTLTLRDGTVVQFAANGAAGHVGYLSGRSRITAITKPDKLSLSFTYSIISTCPATINSDGSCSVQPINNYRLTSVYNSAGYQIHFDYYPVTITGFANDSELETWLTLKKATAFNETIESCSPSAVSCSFTNSWPTAQFSFDQTTATDPLGLTTTYTYSSNQITKVQKPNSVIVTPTYDGSGRVATWSDGVNTWHYGYVDSGTTRTTTVTDPLSHTRVYISNTSLGQVASMTDELGHMTSYAYDSFGRRTQVTQPEGNYVLAAYDGRGNVTSMTSVAKSGSGLANIVTRASYPTTCSNVVTCNEPTATFDGLNNETDYTFDPTHGGILTATNPAVGGVRPQTRYTYTQIGSNGSPSSTGVYSISQVSACRTTASCIGSADETRETITYGSNMLPTSTLTGAGDGSLSATNSVTFDIYGNPYTSTDPVGHVTRYRYDLDRNVTGIVGPDPDGAGSLKNRATRYTFAGGALTLVEQGTVLSQSDADWANFVTLQQVATSYNSVGLKASDSLQVGTTTYAFTQYGYDALDRLNCTAQRMNPAKFSGSLASACMLGIAGSYGPDRIMFDTYDNAGDLTKVTSGYGVTTANGFPATLQRDETTYTYSNNGKVKTLADAKNNLTTYVYDGFDRLSQTQYPSPTTAGSSNAADYEQLGYDAASNVTGRRLRGSTLAAGSYDITYGYDALNRMSSKARPSPELGVIYAYDNLGHPRTIQQGTGTANTFSFDALGRETGEVQPYGSVAYQYDLAGNRTRLTWGDGIYVTFDYDAANEMTAVHENGSTVIASLTYDDLGRRATRTYGSGAVSTYNYDAISRLTSIALSGASNLNTTTLSNYNPAGEIGSKANTSDTYAWTLGTNASRGYTTNGLNQYTAIAGSSVGYDAKGNVTSLSGLTYTYSSENLLTSISTSTPSTYSYDALNRLAEMDNSSESVRFVYDGDNIVQEVFLNGTVARRYVPGPLPNETLVWYDGTGIGTKRYFDTDERGSTTRVSNQSGTSWSIDSYDEYGTPGSNNSGRFEYTGYALMDTAGIYYAKARMYSPALGRFLQTDPVGYGDGPNWYNYVHGNPINWLDPLGMDDIGVTAISCPSGQRRDAIPNPYASDAYEPAQYYVCVTEPGGSVLSGPSPISDPGDGGGGGRSGQQNEPACPQGARIVIGGSGSATGFLMSMGFSGSAGGGIAIPLSSLLHFSLTGSQAFATASVAQLNGAGFFAGAGPSFNGGIASGPITSTPTSTPTISVVTQAGLADGTGGEVSISSNVGSNGEISGVGSGVVSGGKRYGVGAYAAFGPQASYTWATGGLGCH